MRPLVLMLTWMLRAQPVMCEVPAPINAKISSHHFVHLLTWKPGPASPKDVYYKVSITSLKSGASWEPVAGCEHVTRPLLCNMTEAFTDLYQVYYCKIQAVVGPQISPEAVTEGFKPIQDTHLDPPIVSLRPCERGLCVGLQPPVAGLDEVYDSLSYALSVFCKSMVPDKFSVSTKSLKEVILPDLAPGREYCVAVSISDNLERRDSSYGSFECVHTKDTHTPDKEAAAALCVSLVVGVIVVILLVYTGVFCLQTSMPELLRYVKHHEKRMVTDPAPETVSSTVYVEAVPPSAFKKENSSQTCQDSEEETEDSSGGRRVNYEAWPTAISTMANSSSSSLFSSSSSISSSCQLLPGPKPGATTDQTSQSSGVAFESQRVRPPPPSPDLVQQAQPVSTTHRPSPAHPGGQPLSARPLWRLGPASKAAQCSPASVEVRLEPRPAVLETDLRTEEAGGPEEGSGEDVNLLSVKLGVCWPEEGVASKAGVSKEAASPCGEEGAAVSPVTSGDWCCVDTEDEEEDEECDGYMKR